MGIKRDGEQTALGNFDSLSEHWTAKLLSATTEAAIDEALGKLEELAATAAVFAHLETIEAAQ